MLCNCAPALATARDTEPIAQLPGRNMSGVCAGGNGFSTVLIFLPVRVNGIGSFSVFYSEFYTDVSQWI